MKKLLLTGSAILFCAIFLHSCKKNSVDEQYTETVTPVTPDLSTPVSAFVGGFITDENGNAIIDATVKAGTITVNTDEYGYFKINNAGFVKDAGFVAVTKAGYFTGYRSFIPTAGKEHFIRLQLIPKTITGNISGSTGGSVTTADGATITLPANAVVIASNNIAYTGNVHVAVHWLDPSSQTTQQIMPGDLRGIDTNGHLNVLTTYGMLAVELYSDADELLQIAPGKKAMLNFPIPASLGGTAPTSIPLWYFDTSNGLWKEDGVATRSGSNYTGEVSHFTFWNCDVPNLLVNFSVQLVDFNLNPISNTAVRINITGSPNSSRTDYTDTSGFVSGMIPANSSLDMNVMTMCSASVYFKNFTTTNVDVNLGSIKIDIPTYTASFNGLVNKCNGSPVTDGYVIISGGYNSVVNIQNGAFHTTGIICGNSNVNVIAFDRESTQQSSIQNTDITTGVNDLGTFTACNASTVENISYMLDGVDHSIDLPFNTFNTNYILSSNYTSIKAVDLVSGNSIFDLDFNGPAGGLPGPGSFLINGNDFHLDRPYTFNTLDVTVLITNYGLIGEFITGSFGGLVTDVTDMSIHDFQCTFNVKRDN